MGRFTGLEAENHGWPPAVPWGSQQGWELLWPQSALLWCTLLGEIGKEKRESAPGFLGAFQAAALAFPISSCFIPGQKQPQQPTVRSWGAVVVVENRAPRRAKE